MDLKGKRILILGGTTQLSDAVLTAKEMGMYVIVADYLENSPAKKMADRSYLCSITDVDGLIQICKQENVDGVMNLLIDPGQIAYCRICETLNLPCFGTMEQFEILTNKKKFKEFCKKHNVDVIQEYSLDEENLDAALQRIEYPVMVKPVDSRGSRGQTECYCPEDVKKAIPIAKNHSSDGNILAERLMKAENDFSVIYMVKEGIPYPVWLGDRYLGTLENKLNKVALASCAPSKFSELYFEKINHRVCSMIQDLGVVNGPVFFQGFWEDGTVRFYDPGLRFPGGQGYRFYKEIYGSDLLRMLLHFAVVGELGEVYGDIESDCLFQGKTAVIFSPTLMLGKIKEIHGLDQIRSLPEVIDITQIYFEGDCVEEFGNVKSRFGYILILAGNKRQAVEIIQHIQSCFHVLDEQGDDMVFQSFLPERLM